jgi:hypothetical protein
LLSRGDDVYNLNTTRPELYNDIQNLSSDNPAESYYTNYVTSYKESGFLLQNKGYRYSIN